MDKVLIHDTTWNMTSQRRGRLTCLYGPWRHKAEDIWLTSMEHDVTKQRTFDLPLWNITSQSRGHL